MRPDPVLLLAAEAPSAGGAETVQIAIATAGAIVLTTALLVLGLGHRTGRLNVLRRAGGLAERAIGIPAWAALPMVVAVPTLLGALFGLTWDESLHIDDGRDAGPLANPSHYFILVGIFGIFAAGWLSLILPEPGERPGPAPVRLTRDWHVPVGGLVVTVCSAVSLTGFPLDDVSHRLFGQDVSLWGTTHLQMLTGMAVGVAGLVLLFREGVLAARAREGGADEIRPLISLPPRVDAALEKLQYATVGGGLLAALSIYQGEFDFGVPQFRLVFHPILVAGIAAFALVTVRALAGPGAALLAALWFVVVRGVITVLVGPVFGESVAVFPPYVVEALLVEAAAVVLLARRGPYAFAALSGVLLGTVGVLAGYVTADWWSPIPWPAHLLPEAMALSVPVAVACGVGGAFFFGGLARRPELLGRGGIAAVLASVALVGGLFAVLRTTDAPDVRAQVTVEETRSGERREVVATVRLDPPQAVRDADWFHTLAYQGKGPVRIDDLREVAPGVYRTAPLPVHGTWKSAVRLHRGGDMVALPIFLPGDPAIPAAEVPAPARFERAFTGDREILQRERKDDVSRLVETGFAGLILLICLGLLAILGRATVHLGRSGASRAAGGPAARSRARVPAGVA